MFLLGVPLLMFPFTVYNILVFLMPGFSWSNEIWHFRVISGGELGLTSGDAMIAAAVVLLLIEMLKSGRMSRRNVVDHLLSLTLFAGMMAEFMLVKAVVSNTFFLLLVVSFVDVVGGFAVSAPAIPSDVSVPAAPSDIVANETEQAHTA
jgi:hypothetical protein